MCLLALRYDPDAPTRLLVAANRDERHARPTDPARWRDDVLCGLDLEAGGTWLGVSRSGRFAALTNIYRSAPGPRSRGELILGFLRSGLGAEAWMERIEPASYGGFHLVCYDGAQLFHTHSRADRPQPVEPGIHAWTNNEPGQPWAKSATVRAGLERLDPEDTAGLLELMASGRADGPATMAEVPHRIFVRDPHFGTRCSTVVRLGPGRLGFVERRYDAASTQTGQDVFELAGDDALGSCFE